MSDFYEVDFLDVESKKSGDAIGVRYSVNGSKTIHIVDGGYQDFSETFIDHINKHYGYPKYIDRVIVTHPDGDHAGGLRGILEHFSIGELWMLRPWAYSEELIPRFQRFQNADNLTKRLKEIFPNISALEEIAERKNIPIFEPLQGARIGEFVVLAPTKERYLNCIINDERSPEPVKEEEPEEDDILGRLFDVAVEAVKTFAAIWGFESFSPEETSPRNEMSVIQFAEFAGRKIMLTGDAGRAGLTEAINFSPYAGIQLPGLHLFQVPHHGSRRNVNSEILDAILGEKLLFSPEKGKGSFSAIVSAAKEDKDHPKKAVVRALMHRGANVITTEQGTVCNQENGPSRGWGNAVVLDYPEQIEE